MAYTLAELRAKLPTDKSFHEFPDEEGRALFIARWKADDFESVADFIRFCFMYSSALQALIEDVPLAEVDNEYFVPDEESEPAAKQVASTVSLRDMDAQDWLTNADLDVATPEWLNRGDHPQCCELPGGVPPDLVAFGPAGYLHAFVCDLVAH